MFVVGAIIGVIGNATTQLLGKGYSTFQRDLTKDKELISLVDGHIKKFNCIYDCDIMQLEKFIRSQEVENVCRQLFSADILITDRQSNTELIYEEFERLVFLHLDNVDTNNKELPHSLFDALIAGCTKVYETEIKGNNLFAHEKMDGLRFRRLKDEIENILINIETLKTKDRPTIQEYLEFEKKYRDQVVERNKYLRSVHFKNPEKILIDDLYVYPNFSDSLNSDDKEQEFIDSENFISSIYRSVVLGDPGAGKTTFTSKICYDFGRGLTSEQSGGRDVTPILIVLRDYGIKFESYGYSIVQYIEEISRSWHQENPPKGAFDYLLKNGRAFVIFDGLDELLDTSKRQLISDNIESFCSLYPSVPILVTSRKVGYEQAQLNKDRFKKYYLSDFNSTQVKEYVEKWFTQNLLVEEEIDKKVLYFLKESHSVKDLRSNPLMLSLMCDLYRGEGYIPKNRPDVYEKCSELLFRKWDKIRGVDYKLSFEAHLKSTLMFIAYTVYSNEKLQGSVPEETLIDITSKYLFPNKFDDEDVALSVAKEFIDFCKGRAWVFSEVGSPGNGDNLYQFTHRTFLEYFTAYYLVRNYRSPKELNNFLLPKIIKREWDVVAQLSYQLQNKNLEDAENELLLRIIEEVQEKDIQSQFNLLSFAVRSLEFLVPSPQIISKIVSSCIEYCIDLSIHNKVHNFADEHDITIDELINPMKVADNENIPSIRKSIIKNISQNLYNSDKEKASSSLKIFSAFPRLDLFSEIKGKTQTSKKLKLDKIISETFKENSEIIKKICENNEYNASEGVNYDILSTDEVMDLYSPGILYSISAVHGTSPILTTSIIELIFSYNSYQMKQDINNWRDVINDISQISQKMQSFQTPWHTFTYPFPHPIFSKDFIEMISLLQEFDEIITCDETFDFFIIIAPMIEFQLYGPDLSTGTSKVDYLGKMAIFNEIWGIDNQILKPLLFVFRSKLVGAVPEEFENIMSDSCFTEKQKDMMRQWTDGKMSFLEIETPFSITEPYQLI